MKNSKIKIIVAVFLLIAILFLVEIIFLAYMFKNKPVVDNSADSYSENKSSSTSEINISKDSILYFNPSQKEISTGEDFTIDAMINPGKNKITAMTLYFVFDQTKLRLDSIASSENFSLVLADAVIDNSNGTASIDVAVPTANPSVTEISKIVTLNFHALKSAKDSPVDYTLASQVAAEGEAQDVARVREGAFVSIE